MTVLKFNKLEAKRHIEALSGNPNSIETFQVVYSNKHPTESELRNLNFGTYPNGQLKAGTFRTGTLDSWSEWLEYQNNQGCGIYIMVNRGDGKGRKASNITAIRALFAEDDLGQTLDFNINVKPNLIIQSKKGTHNYFLLQSGQKILDFSLAQQTLISHFNCDMACKDICRVLRLAGAWHVGDINNPLEIKITHLDTTAKRYTTTDIVSAYPAKAPIRAYEPTAVDIAQYEASLAGTSPDERITQAIAFVQKYPPLISGFGERANKTLAIAARVYHEFGILDESKTFDILKRWNSNSPDPWTENELRGFIHNAAGFSGHAPGKALIQNRTVVSPDAAGWLVDTFN